MINKKLLDILIPVLLIVAIAISMILVLLVKNSKLDSNNTGTTMEYENKIFNTRTIIDLSIDMDADSWQKLLDNASKKKYYSCNVTINGETYNNVGIRAKGSSSLDDVKNIFLNNRYSLMLKFNKYVDGQTYHSLDKLALNNCIYDATSMKDTITYDMCSYIGLSAPLCNYVKVSLNNDYLGCYLAVEPVTKSFLTRNYSSSSGTVYEPYGSLSYADDNISSYADITADLVTGKSSDASLKRIVTAIKSVYTGENTENYVDVDSIMKYMAIQTIAINYDGLTGSDAHNYYLYEHNSVISIIPWDYNLAYGGYTDTGEDKIELNIENAVNMTEEEYQAAWDKAWKEYYNSLSKEEKAALEASTTFNNTKEVIKYVNFPIDTPFSCDLSERSFFMKLLSNDTYKAKYYRYLSILSSKYIQGRELEKTMATITRKIGDIVGTESNAFYSNEQFTTATNTFKELLNRKAQSILYQIAGTIPSTWDAQKANSTTLIDASDINLPDMGGNLK